MTRRAELSVPSASVMVMRGGIPGRRTDVCMYDDRCASPPSDRFSVDLCDRHALKVHEIVEMNLARERLNQLIVDHRPDDEPLVDVTSEFRSQCVGWLGRSAPKDGPGGFVYYVRLGSMVKIGFSRNVTNRLRDVPHEEILKVEQGTMGDEARAHQRCSTWRVVGEWFRDSDEFREAAGVTSTSSTP